MLVRVNGMSKSASFGGENPKMGGENAERGEKSWGGGVFAAVKIFILRMYGRKPELRRFGRGICGTPESGEP